MQHYEDDSRADRRVRARWRTLCALQALLRGALIAAAVIGVAVVASRWTTGAPVVLMLLAAAALILAGGALAWCLAPLRRVPADGKVARYIEERTPSLDDRLVTAVDVAQRERRARLCRAMLADAARRDRGRRHRHDRAGRIAAPRGLSGGGRRCSRSASLLFIARGPARQAARRGVADAVSRARRARRDARQRAESRPGSPLAIQARLVGNRAPVIAQVQIADGDRWRDAEMASDKPGRSGCALPSVDLVVQVPRRRRRGDVADLRRRRSRIRRA